MLRVIRAVSIYTVEKTSFDRFPVYTDIKYRNNVKNTIVRRISGDIPQLKSDLEQAIFTATNATPKIVIKEISKSIVISGDYAQVVLKFLKKQ